MSRPTHERRNGAHARRDAQHDHDRTDDLRSWLVFHLSDKIADFLNGVRSPRIWRAMATTGFSAHHQRRAWRALNALWALPEADRLAELQAMFAWYRRWANAARAVLTHRDDLERLGLAAGGRIPGLPQGARLARAARSAA